MIFSNNPEARLNSQDNILNRKDIVHKRVQAHKSGHTTTPIPDFIKPLISATAKIEPERSVARSFGISRESVHSLKQGFNSHIDYQNKHNPDGELLDKTNDRVTEIGDMALSKLALSLGLITNEKLEGEKPLSLSRVARDMAAVFKDTRASNQIAENIGQVVVMAPSQKDLNQYDVVEVAGRVID